MPSLSSETRHHTNPRFRSTLVDSGYWTISAPGQPPRNRLQAGLTHPGFRPNTEVPFTRPAHMDPRTRASPVGQGSRPVPRQQESLLKRDSNTIILGDINTTLGRSPDRKSIKKIRT